MSGVRERKNLNPYADRLDGSGIIKKVIAFLQLFMPVTLAKRAVAMVLLAAGLSSPRVTELTGLCDRSTRELLKSIQEQDAASLLSIKAGSGRKSKVSGLEGEIIAEIGKDNYHTRQQIADMIKEKFHVSLSVSSVGKLLKKTVSGD